MIEVNEETKPNGERSEKESADLVAGRELDAAVAERVMGWRWMSRVDDSRNSNPYRSAWLFPPDSVDTVTAQTDMFGRSIITRNHIVGPFKEYDGGRKEKGSNVPRYSTDIAASMEVVEKVRERGYGVVMADNMGGKPWSVDIVATAAVFEGDADTLPLAICRAALAAVDATHQQEAQ